MKIEIVQFGDVCCGFYRDGKLYRSERGDLASEALAMYVDSFEDANPSVEIPDVILATSTASRGHECEMPPNNWPAEGFK